MHPKVEDQFFELTCSLQCPMVVVLVKVAALVAFLGLKIPKKDRSLAYCTAYLVDDFAASYLVQTSARRRLNALLLTGWHPPSPHMIQARRTSQACGTDFE